MDHFRSEKGTAGTEMRPASDSSGIVTSDTLWPNTMTKYYGQYYIHMSQDVIRRAYMK